MERTERRGRRGGSIGVSSTEDGGGDEKEDEEMEMEANGIFLETGRTSRSHVRALTICVRRMREKGRTWKYKDRGVRW